MLPRFLLRNVCVPPNLCRAISGRRIAAFVASRESARRVSLWVREDGLRHSEGTQSVGGEDAGGTGGGGGLCAEHVVDGEAGGDR